MTLIDINRVREPQTVDGRPPPHDLDAEAAVISACILACEQTLPIVIDVVRPEDFYSEAHRQIFVALEALWRAAQHVDMVTLATRLKDTERLAQVGGISYLKELLDAAPTLTGAESYARTVSDKARIRKVIAECQRVAANGYLGVEDAQVYCDEAERALGRLARAGGAHELEKNKTILARIVDATKNAKARGLAITGIRSGIDRVDRLTNGIHRGQFSIIAARPGIGKTAYAKQVAYYTSRQDVGTLFFSAEMKSDDILRRILCSESGVSETRMIRGELIDREWGPLTQATLDIARAPLWVDDTPGMTAAHIRGVVMRKIANRKPGEPELGVVVVDYLQKLRSLNAKLERRHQIAETSEALRRIAVDLNVAVIATAQLNRDSDKGGKSRRPVISDLRECGDIEQDAFVVQLLHRERNYGDRDEYNTDVIDAEIILGKNRNGPETIVNVGWCGAFTRFENLEEGR